MVFVAPVLLLLLDLGDLISVFVGRGGRLAHFALRRPDPAEESAERRAEPAEAAVAVVSVVMMAVMSRRTGRIGQFVFFVVEQSPALVAALTGAAIFGRISVAQTVGVARRLPVAEIGAVAAAADASRHPRLFDSLADEDAILFELFRQDGVEERIAAGIERQDEDGEYFGFFQRHELETGSGRQREEGDGCPAEEIGEDEQGHPFGDPRIVGIPGLRPSNGAVHLKKDNQFVLIRI